MQQKENDVRNEMTKLMQKKMKIYEVKRLNKLKAHKKIKTK